MASMQLPLGQPPVLMSKDTADISPTPNKAVGMHLGASEPVANRPANNVQPNSPTTTSLTEAFTSGKKTKGTACEQCRKAKVSYPCLHLLTHFDFPSVGVFTTSLVKSIQRRQLLQSVRVKDILVTLPSLRSSVLCHASALKSTTSLRNTNRATRRILPVLR